ncbi:MAG TPA: hypothetical protein ENN22_06050 [bacterium]|nr:hypothetical protein [bacterium]
MKRALIKFFRYQGKIVIITIILIVIIGCVTWRTFVRTPDQEKIRRDYYVHDISQETGIDPKRIAGYSSTQLEIIDRLDLNGLIALERFPKATERIYQEVKDFRIFYEIIDDFGPQHIIPVLDYFYDEGNLALTIEENLSHWLATLFKTEQIQDSLSERQQRLLAILNEINYQKHNFLARFIYTDQGARRNYVSTTTSALIGFFTGGLSNFNAAIVTRGISQVTTEELVDAGIDIIILIPIAAWLTRSAKTSMATLRGGKVIAGAERTAVRQATGTIARTGRFARLSKLSQSVWRTIPLRTLFKFRYVKWYILAVAVAKPSLINHAAALVAKAFSIPTILVKTGFWFLILFPILNLIIPVWLLLRYFLRKIHPPKKIAAVPA